MSRANASEAATPDSAGPLIAQWRQYLESRPGVTADAADELEDHLRGHLETLTAAGLSTDEALLVSIKRVGAQHEVAREFARDHSKRLWKQLVLDYDSAEPPARGPSQAVLALTIAAAAGLAARAVVFGLDRGGERFLEFAPALPALGLSFLALYFALARGVSARVGALIALVMAVPAAVAVALPVPLDSQSVIIMSLHLPLLAWLGVGVAYAAGRWREHAARMDFIRFTGEWVIYMTLLALGGQVVLLLTVAVFGALGVDAVEVVFAWVLPIGAGGATVIAAWLVEAKQSVVENIAPVLTRIFTPIVTLMVVAFLGGFVVTAASGAIDRDALILFDALLALVLGLVLYALSARQADARVSWFDWLQLALVAGALVLDALVLGALAMRIGEWGLTPNRVVGLGMNLVLLVNLAVAAWWGLRFARGRVGVDRLERWQTSYVPVYGAWAAVAAFGVPLAFSFA